MSSSTAMGALEVRVGKLENALTEGLKDIKQLIVDEIRDLKSEQLADIRGTVDRVEKTLKEELTRLADDQRRLWDDVQKRANRTELDGISARVSATETRLSTLEGRDNQRQGASRALIAIWAGISFLTSAAITAGLEAVIFHH